METLTRCMDSERIKDFSSIPYDIAKRPDSLKECSNQATISIKDLTAKNRLLSEEVVCLQRVNALNNVFIALKCDANIEFEPIAIQKIVQEILNVTKDSKRSCPSDDAFSG